MRITRLLLENYYGIFLATGKKKIEIFPGEGKNKIIVLKGGNGSGKAQPVTTRLQTPSGMRVFGTLQPGELVYNEFGGETEIDSVHPQGQLEQVRVTFDDGTFTYVGWDHLWTIIAYSKKGEKLEGTYTTEELYKEELREESGDFRFRIPVTEAVEMEKKELPIDPYMLGIEFSNFNNFTGGLHQAGIDNYTELGLFDETMGVKLTTDYMTSSIEDRTNFINGYAVDNAKMTPNRTYIIDAQNCILEKNISFIMNSLGAIKLKNDKLINEDGYKVEYAVPRWTSLFEGVEPKRHIQPINFVLPTKFIASIKSTGKAVPMMCIKVKNSTGLYLTNDFIVTHNTTILSALHPFHETFDHRKDPITPDANGKKEVTIEHDGHVYEMRLLYYRRSQNKAYISKDGHELNENGNITSYKEVISDTFKLTGEYFKISKMGDNVSSFVDMTTANRKTYISKIQPAVDEFLKLFKIVSGKFTLQSKLVNSTSDKIGKFPTEEVMEETKNSILEVLEPAETKLKKKEGKLQVLISELKEYIKSLPSINDTLIPANKKVKEHSQILSKSNNHLTQTLEKYSLEEDTKENFQARKTLAELKRVEFATGLTGLKENLARLEADIETSNEKIEEYEGELASVSEDSINDMKHAIIELRNKINELLPDVKNHQDFQKYVLETYNIEEVWDEFSGNLSLIETVLKLFTSSWSNFYDVNNGNIPYDEVITTLTQVTHDLDIAKRQRDAKIKEVETLESNFHLYETLQKRPADCTIDSCSFIVKAREYKDLPKQIEIANHALIDLKARYDALEVEHGELEILKQARASIDGSLDDVLTWEHVLVLLANSKEDEERIERLLALPVDETPPSKLSFDISTLTARMTALKNIVKIEELKTKLDDQQQTYDLLKAKEDTITLKSQTLLDNERLNGDSLFAELDTCTTDIGSKQKSLNKYISQIDIITEILGLMDNIDEATKTLDEYNQLANTYELYVVFRRENEEKQGKLTTRINELTELIKSNRNRLETANNTLSNYAIFKAELEELSETFEDIKNVKNVLDPKSGIPLIFIGEYLNRTKAITNRLLSTVYDDIFQIDFEITDTDFSIPIYRNGVDVPSPDLKVLSQGETIIVKISLSLAMIEQAMTDYNIMYLDEVDGPLSEKNRSAFIKIVEDQVEYLGIEQVFVISHNKGFDAANCDFILMKEASPDFMLSPNQEILADFR